MCASFEKKTIIRYTAAHIFTIGIELYSSISMIFTHSKSLMSLLHFSMFLGSILTKPDLRKCLYIFYLDIKNIMILTLWEMSALSTFQQTATSAVEVQ